MCSAWLNDQVTIWVKVVCTVGFGKNVVAKLYGLVGFNGVFFLVAIFFPGYVCIAAYLVRPVCSQNGTAKAPSAPAGVCAVDPARALILLGPSVPEMVESPCKALAGKTPVMPVKVKRGEKLVIVPPVEATEIILRKLSV